MKKIILEYMTVYDHGTDKIDLTHLLHPSSEVIPIEFHFKADGAKDDKPSIAIISRKIGIGGLPGVNVFGQMSLNTLDKCLNEVGYKIVKNEKATTN